ncbi:MAG: 16S rRNA (uracil(1498)-N(3))-methyltransferase [Campylobacterota bacterium]|nr:16S rRNA (uracil(1498)-N(3))-methyltransferase [Campylobacterota bacterium]
MDLIYIFLDESPKKTLTLKGELHKYLIKVRRHEVGDEIFFRDREKIGILYRYKISGIDARSLNIELISSEDKIVKGKKDLHIAWCMIDSKSIEKVLPSLSEIGVSRISFIACDRSQKNFKIDFKRYNRILEASMQQCGRSTYIEFDIFKNIQEFISEFPDTKVFDFTEKTLDDYGDIKTVLIGCEGGFSDSEREFLKTQDVFRLDTPMILRSESAVMAVASKIIL